MDDMADSAPLRALRKTMEGGRHREFRQLLLDMEGAAVDETLIGYVDQYLSHFHTGKRRIATTNPDRQPAADEVVVQFGNYPPAFESLAVHNPMRRNILDYWTVQWDFSQVEFSPCWRSVDRVFVINLDHRPDRFYSVVRELTRMGVPLDRIVRVPGCVHTDSDDAQVNGQVGCLTSHLQVCRIAADEGLQNVLVVEDDFGFIDDVKHVESAMEAFFARQYGYDVCLLATSKIGPIEPFDDLVSMSRQKCTNTGAYLVSRAGSARLVECFSGARDRLVATGDCLRFAVDRCWSGLQGERFLVFKRRLGFQLPGFSDIEKSVTMYLD
jgi:hypothetical protein